MVNRPNSGPVSLPQYFFECSHCRRPIHVNPAQAGSKLDCVCGVTNMVPSVIQLRAVQPLASSPSAPAAGASPGGSPFAQQPRLSVNAVNCPFCSRPMQHGRIVGDRYRLKWLAADVPLTLGIWAVGGVDIGHGGAFTFVRAHAFGWRCGACRKIVVDERM